MLDTSTPAPPQHWWPDAEHRTLHSVAEELHETENTDVGSSTCGAPVVRDSTQDPTPDAPMHWCAECLHAGGWLTVRTPVTDATVGDVAVSILSRLPLYQDEPDAELTDTRDGVGPWFATTADPVCSTAASQDLQQLYDTAVHWYYQLETLLRALGHDQGEHTEHAREHLRLAVAGFEHLIMLGLDSAVTALHQHAPAPAIDDLRHRHTIGAWPTPLS